MDNRAHERLSEGSVRGEVFYYMSKAKKKLVIKTVAAIPGVCFVAWQCHIRFPWIMQWNCQVPF